MKARMMRGTMVFWGDDNRPWWVLEWQQENGPGCYLIVNAAGESGAAGEDELTLYPAS